MITPYFVKFIHDSGRFVMALLSSLEISTLESSNLEIGIAPATTLSTTYLRFASFTYAISKT